jgi:hypothetical protein
VLEKPAETSYISLLGWQEYGILSSEVKGETSRKHCKNLADLAIMALNCLELEVTNR